MITDTLNFVKTNIEVKDDIKFIIYMILFLKSTKTKVFKKNI